MKTAFSLFLIFISNVSLACRLEQPILSLSGPVTMLLEELDLLKDKNLLAISTFHPIKKEFKGEVLAGGLFLSKRTLKKYRGKTILFDKSRELKNFFNRSFKGSFYEVDTRGINPFQANEIAYRRISSFLKGCEKKLSELNLKFSQIQKSIGANGRLKRSVFFLGKIKSKLPEIVLSHDGFVLSLKKIKDFKTYPSKLNYTTWSKKILNKLDGYLFIGIEDGQSDDLKITKVSKSKYTFAMRGILIPGIRQIYFLNKFSQLSFH